MAHSKEPWKVADRGREIVDAQRELVFQRTLGARHDRYEADFERIVACVNFCRQFPTEWLAERQIVYVKDKDGVRTASDIRGFDGFVPSQMIPVAKGEGQ